LNKHQVRARIEQIGIIPVIRASSEREAHIAAEAVCKGGIPIVEITMTCPGAINVIRDLNKTQGSEILIGAGTVNRATVEFAARESKLIMAGALTPTEIIEAWSAGSDLVKVFPCGQVGGAKYIKALKGPLPQIPLVPTGGVNLSTAAEFIEAGAVALGIGGELIHPEALKSNNPELIVETARKFLEIVARTRAKSQ
jgi:2-dehydro-3-deoxyphosphogluconate aldolase / (4S)-4-hydroxy-2-oxoglutarate aldolase